MRSSTSRSCAHRWWCCVTLTFVAAAVLTDRHVVDVRAAGPDGSGTGASSIAADRQPDAPRLAPPPQRLTSSGLRPLDRAEAERLRGGGVQRHAACDIDFDDDAAIALLPDGAETTFAFSPWWNQLCNDRYVRVYPTDTDHLHLGYVDDTIDLCVDADNPYGTPLGTFSRGEDCEPIDPVTEPRSWINVGHYADLHGRLELVDAYGSDYTPRPFTLERMRIRSAPARVCYRMPASGGWIAAAPVGPFDKPGLVYCWASLSPGLWDLSEWTFGTVGVDFTGSTGSLPGYDDFRIG